MIISVKQSRLKQLKTFHSFSLIIRKTHPEPHVKIFEKLTKINDLTTNTCYLFDPKNALKIRFLTEFHVFFPVKGC